MILYVANFFNRTIVPIPCCNMSPDLFVKKLLKDITKYIRFDKCHGLCYNAACVGKSFLSVEPGMTPGPATSALMSDLLTTRQLQELLQVDRITIYRMLNDGRLTGFKVGGQWRFSRQEIEKWLQGQRDVLDVTEMSVQSVEMDAVPHVLPLSCVRAIQAIYAESLQIAAITTEPNGTPLMLASNSCRFCDLVLSTEEGRRRCEMSWRLPNDTGQTGPIIHLCHAGLQCIGVPIRVNDEWVGNSIGCQFVVGEADDNGMAWLRGLPVLAFDLGLVESELRAAAEGVRSLTKEQLSRAFKLLQQVADTFSEIGQERLKLLDRLQRIAEITNV